MHGTLPYLKQTDFPAINRNALEILQVNLGYLCNLSCTHCHVNAGPKRTELMAKATVDMVLGFIWCRATGTLRAAEETKGGQHQDRFNSNSGCC